MTGSAEGHSEVTVTGLESDKALALAAAAFCIVYLLAVLPIDQLSLPLTLGAFAASIALPMWIGFAMFALTIGDARSTYPTAIYDIFFRYGQLTVMPAGFLLFVIVCCIVAELGIQYLAALIVMSLISTVALAYVVHLSKKHALPTDESQEKAD